MIKILIPALLIAASCSAPRPAGKSNTGPSGLVPDGKLFTALFHQQAAEYKALCFQAYNMARFRLDEALSQSSKGTKPLAIVTDIDETVLDNSPYAVHRGLQGKDYEPGSWYEWTARGEADTLAGAYSFFKYASSRNVEVFYITNREEKEIKATLMNLQRFGFPDADEKHLITRSTTSSKEPRRQALMTTHDVILLIGDNLSDFDWVFDKKPAPERARQVQAHATLFGNRYIILPNPNYGDWESALYQYNNRLTPAQKDSVIKAVLKAY